MQSSHPAHVRHNFIVNALDGGFYGLGFYAASYLTVLPLFIATMTDSPLLIGMVNSIHILCWQLPQLLTAGHIARLQRYKPFVLLMTIQERWPYLGLLIIALAAPHLPRELALVLTFAMLVWQSLGAGFTATGWQSMIAKIMPNTLRGTFYGTQSALAQFFGIGGAALAGVLLARFDSPWDYAACFGVASLGMLLSFFFLAQTREANQIVPHETQAALRDVMRQARRIWHHDANFRWFTWARILAQIGLVAQSFLAVFAVQRFGISDALVAGVMTAVMLVSQSLGNPILGWLGDRYGYRNSLLIGGVAALGSALSVLFASGVFSFYLAFALGGIANAALWSIVLAMVPEFGSASERPYYIGLANTLVAPATLLAPVVAGFLAQTINFEAVFVLSVGGALASLLVLYFFVRDPHARGVAVAVPVAGAGD